MMHCPKCRHERRPEHAACVRCGLTVARWACYRTQLPSHEALDPLWTDLLNAWQDPSLHARFIDTAVACRGLTVAATRYRAVSHLPDHRAEADKALKRISLLAERLCMQAVLAARPRAPGRVWRLVAVALGLALVTATGAFLSGTRGASVAVAVAGASLR